MTNKDSEENKKSPSFINVRSLIPKLSEEEQSFRYWILKKSAFSIGEIEYESAKPQLFLLTVFAINRDTFNQGTKRRYFIEIKLNDIVVCYGETPSGFARTYFNFIEHKGGLQAIEEALKFVKKEMGE